MKKLSEAAKIVGVTRRTLQEYDKIGLLSPTAKTEAGYWLYDDAAIKKLMLIRMFVEIGYNRQEIKQLLESPAPDFIDEFDHMISMLEEKKNRIERTIELLLSIRNQIDALSASTIIALGKMDFSNYYENTSFVGYLEKALSQRTGMFDADIEDSASVMLMLDNLIAVGCLKNKTPDDPAVQDCVMELYNSIIQLFLSTKSITNEEKEEFTNVNDQEMAKQLEERLEDMLNDDDFLSILEPCGAGAASFIRKAVQVFANAQTWVYDKDNSTISYREV